jgi:chemotaxis protein MotB
MARKRILDEPDDKDRWLISYADLMTTMFAFFVVLYAVSSVQDMKFQQMSNSLGSALGNPYPLTTTHLVADANKPVLLEQPQISTIFLAAEPIPVSMPAPLNISPILKEPLAVVASELPQLSDEDLRQHQKLEQDKSQIKSIANELEQRLAPFVDQGKVRVSLSNWGISVEINASILFAAAETKLNPDSFEILHSIAQIMKDQPQSIHVAGYTDNKVINNPYYPSNWELSAARASSVVRLLIDAGIDSKRLAALGYADNQPIATNATTDGRMRNRRVQLSIMANSTEELTTAYKNQQATY